MTHAQATTSFDMVRELDHEAAKQVMRLAIGRIWKLMSRSFQDGDIEQYETAKWAAFNAWEAMGKEPMEADSWGSRPEPD